MPVDMQRRVPYIEHEIMLQAHHQSTEGSTCHHLHDLAFWIGILLVASFGVYFESSRLIEEAPLEPFEHTAPKGLHHLFAQRTVFLIQAVDDLPRGEPRYRGYRLDIGHALADLGQVDLACAAVVGGQAHLVRGVFDQA